MSIAGDVAAELALEAVGWRNAHKHPPEPGWIVKRWFTGAVWAGKYDGSTKMASCDEWMILPPPRGHVKDGIVTFGERPGDGS